MIIPTHALSIKQPWAWAILNAGKDVENRDWKPYNPGLKVRGPFFIHAGKKPDPLPTADEVTATMASIEAGRVPFLLAPPRNLPMGGIVGMAEIVDAVHVDARKQLGALWPLSSPWFFGPYGLAIKNPRPLPFIPLKGRLGFFKVDEDIRRRVEAML